MPTYKVFVPDSRSRRLMTATQWLAESRILDKGDRAGRFFVMRQTITLWTIASDDAAVSKHTFHGSNQLMRRLQELENEGAIITKCFSRDWELGALGLHTLNVAVHLKTVRRYRNANSISHYLTRGSFEDLLSYLEIRRRPRAKANRPTVQQAQTAQARI